jgi:hypothetical protein
LSLLAHSCALNLISSWGRRFICQSFRFIQNFARLKITSNPLLKLFLSKLGGRFLLAFFPTFQVKIGQLSEPI